MSLLENTFSTIMQTMKILYFCFIIGPESSSKIFGNSFLDLNPCEKNSTINQSLNNFENIELESLDIDDFLLENGLNGPEAELLEQLTRSETAAQSNPDTSDKALYKNKAPTPITLSDLCRCLVFI